jgi:hypothetical protein
MTVAYPLINGVRHSWASIEIRVAGNIVLGITEINYNDGLEPGVVRGAGARPIALTTGEASFDGDFTILLEEFNTLVSLLGPRWKTVAFDIVVSYSEEDSGLTTIVDTIQGARITKTEAGNSSGSTDGTTRKCTIKPMGLLWNGVDSMPAQPVVQT